MNDLSIVVVSYNTRDLLLQCLESVLESLELAQAGGRLSMDARAISRGYEVIVVDNASTDGSAQAVRRFFPEVRLVENEFNRGFGSANNQAIAISQGRRLLFLNPDVQVQGNAITEMLRFLDRYPRTGMVTCRLKYPDGSFQDSAFRFPTLWMVLLDLFPLHPRLVRSGLNGRYPLNAYRRPFEIDHPLGACMLVRREMIDRVGAFDEAYFMYCEELDWCMRARRDRWRVFCVPQAEMVHHGGSSTAQLPDQMFVELFRSRLRFFSRYYNPFFKVAAKAIMAAGLWWEHSRWLQQYLRNEITEERFQERRSALGMVLTLLATGP